MVILLKPVNNAKKSVSRTGYFLYLLPKQSNYSKKCEAVNHVKLMWRGKGKEIWIFVGIISVCAMLRLSAVSSLMCSLFKLLGVFDLQNRLCFLFFQSLSSVFMQLFKDAFFLVFFP